MVLYMLGYTFLLGDNTTHYTLHNFLAMSYGKIMEDRRLFPGAGLSTFVLFLMLTIGNSTKLAAQRQMTLGAMRNIPQQNSINPALMPDSSKWYIGIPLLSGLGASYRNSSFTPEQFGIGSERSPDFFRAMDFTDTLNQAYGEIYLEDLAFGINVGKNFFSLSIGERITASINYPDELVKWLGYEQEGVDIPLGQVFDLSTWNFSAFHYREIALGVGRKLLDDKLTLAGRAKLLLGQASLRSDNYNLRIWHRPEEEYNYEITGRMDILASGFDRFGEGASPFQLFGSANSGVAFDLGAHLQLGNVSFFASVTDLGKINWNKNNTFTSIKDIAVSGDALLENSITNLVEDRERGATNFSTELVTKVYGGAQLEIGKRKTHAISVLVNPRLYLGQTELYGSVAYRVRTSRFLDVVASYNHMADLGNNFGFGATVNLRPVQIYFATDKALSVFNRNTQKDFHFSAGINLLIGQPKKPKVIVKQEASPVLPPVEDVVQRPAVRQEETITATVQPEKSVDKYFTFYGTVIDDKTREPVDAVYVDVYVIHPDNQRELIHTSRYPGHTFNIPLFQSDLPHEISVGGYGYARNTLSFSADITRLEHEFRMSDGLWTYEEPVPYVDPSQVKLASNYAEEAAGPVSEAGDDLMGGAVSEDNMAATDIDGVFEIIQRTSLRSEPDAQARVMKRLGEGTTLILLEKTDKYWWKMKLGDQVGYVKQRLMVSVQ